MQLLRILRELGFLRLVIAIATIAFGSFSGIAALQKLDDPEWLILLVGVAIFLPHLNRKDKVFFQLYADHAVRIFQLEYAILLSPVVLGLSIIGQWPTAIGCLIMALIVPLINLKSRSFTFNSALQRLIPSQAIEWKSGVRKMLIPIVLLWLMGLTCAFFIPAVPLAIFFLGMLISGFYEKMESLTVLVSSEQNPRSFLIQKIITSVGLFAIMCVPMIIAFSVFHTSHFYIPLVAFVLFSLMISYAICVKYAFYLPEPDSSGNQMLLAIGLMGILIPFVLPVFLFFIGRFYFRAKSNLNLYLHDFN